MTGLLLALMLMQPPSSPEPPLVGAKVAIFVPPAKEKIVYLRGGVWHQGVQMPAEPFTLVGYSAGAHSALPIAVDPCNRGKITKCVLISGIFEMNLAVRLVARGAFCGMTRAEASPLWRIPPAGPGSPWFEVAYGEFDLPGQRHQAQGLVDKLTCCGYKVVLKEICGATHKSLPCIMGYE